MLRFCSLPCMSHALVVFPYNLFFACPSTACPSRLFLSQLPCLSPSSFPFCLYFMVRFLAVFSPLAVSLFPRLVDLHFVGAVIGFALSGFSFLSRLLLCTPSPPFSCTRVFMCARVHAPLSPRHFDIQPLSPLYLLCLISRVVFCSPTTTTTLHSPAPRCHTAFAFLGCRHFSRMRKRYERGTRHGDVCEQVEDQTQTNQTPRALREPFHSA